MFGLKTKNAFFPHQNCFDNCMVIMYFRLIEGFMDKTNAQNVLMSVQPGNFLLRFADSDPGGISVTWVSGE